MFRFAITLFAMCAFTLAVIDSTDANPFAQRVVVRQAAFGVAPCAPSALGFQMSYGVQTAPLAAPCMQQQQFGLQAPCQQQQQFVPQAAPVMPYAFSQQFAPSFVPSYGINQGFSYGTVGFQRGVFHQNTLGVNAGVVVRQRAVGFAPVARQRGVVVVQQRGLFGRTIVRVR